MTTILKPRSLGVLNKVERRPPGASLVVGAVGHFRLLGGAEFETDEALWPIVAKQVHPPSLFDMAMPKPTGEVLLGGYAVAPGGVPVRTLRGGVEIGSVRKEFAALGDRYWTIANRGYVFTEPAPFLEIPLALDRAYGGAGHAASPSGRGHGARAAVDRGEAVALPNLEDPARLIHGIDDAPAPMRVGSIDPTSPERLRYAGTYDQAWLGKRFPGLPDDADPRLFMVAPPDQWNQTYFGGDEPFRLVGQNAEHPVLEGRLPGLRARAFVRFAGRAMLFEVPLVLDTVWFFGSAGIGALIFRGACAVEDIDGRDVSHVMFASERLGEPRPLEHYEEVFRLRTDPETRPHYLMRDEQLTPPPPAEVLAARHAAREAFTAEILLKFREAATLQTELACEAAGLPPELMPRREDPETLPFLLPTPDDIRRGDVDFAGIERAMLQMKEDADAEIRESLGGIDLDALRDGAPPGAAVGSLLARHGIEPGSLRAELDSARATLASDLADRPEAADADAAFAAFLARTGGVFGEAPDAPAADPDVEYRQACERFFEAPEASMLQGATDRLREARGEVAAILANPPDGARLDAEPEPVSLDRILGDLTAGLQDLPADKRVEAPDMKPRIGTAMQDLGYGGDDAFDRLVAGLAALAPAPRGPEETLARFDQAVESAETAERDLRAGLARMRQKAPKAAYPLEPLSNGAARRFGATVVDHHRAGGSLEKRDMAGVDLAGTDLVGANLVDALLEKAKLAGANLAGCRAAGAAFTEADLTCADLTGADLTGANLAAATLNGTRLDRASLDQLLLIETAGPDARFAGAQISATDFVAAAFARADFSGARLSRVNFVKVDLTGARFDGAVLDTCSFLDCRMDGVSFRGADLRRVTTGQVSLAGVDFAAARLVEVAVTGPVDMSGANFEDAIADGATFFQARLGGARFYRARLDRATLMESDIDRADLRYASLASAMLGSVSAVGARFDGANLREAMLRRADLSGASLAGANLHACDLNDATLMGADFGGANLAHTIFGMPTHAR